MAWCGLVLHVLVFVYPFASSGLLAPLWGVVLLWTTWAALLVLRGGSGSRPDTTYHGGVL